MRHYLITDFRDHSIGAGLRRFIASIGRRLMRGEKLGGYRPCRGADGYDYIHPAPTGAVTMAKRRTWKKTGD